MVDFIDFSRYSSNTRCYRDRLFPFDLDDVSDETIRGVYRFNRNDIRTIIRDLEHTIEAKYVGRNLRGRRLTSLEHVMIALKFYAHGTSFRALGEQYGVGIGTVSRVIDVTNGIISTYNDLSQMPLLRDTCREHAREFYDLARIPNVIGCIDGTLIPIQRPNMNEDIYVSRKGYHAINCMFVCKRNLQFIYMDCRFPGATQDAAVYRESSLRQGFEDGRIPQGYLLGDSGYALSEHLMTPVRNDEDPAAAAYNRAHRKTRQVIERAFGVLKSRFRCIDKSGGPLRFSPEKSTHVITAVALLHNKAVEMNSLPVDDMDNFVECSSLEISEEESAIPTSRGLLVRENLINMFRL